MQNALFKYATPSTGLKVLESSSLRWSAPKLFNDIFDVPDEILSNFKEEGFYKVWSKKISEIILNPDQYNPSELSPEAEVIWELAQLIKGDQSEVNRVAKGTGEIDLPLSDDAFRFLEELRMKWRLMHDDHRILCLTENANSASMWSRYADEYRGIMLEFRCDTNTDSVFKLAEPVHYSDEPHHTDTLDGFADFLIYNDDRVIKKLFHEYTHTKTADWSDENEWRIASFACKNEDGLFADYGFAPIELDSCTLGIKIDSGYKARILETICTKYPHAVSGGLEVVYLWRFESAYSSRFLALILK
jgi:hypothetical protein